MRYLLLFFVLFFHSYLAVAQEPSCSSTSRTPAHCASIVAGNNASTTPSQMLIYSYCEQHPVYPTLMRVCTVARCASPFINDPSQPSECVCPDGQFEYVLDQASGQKTCGPVCTFPQIPNIVTQAGVTTVSCIDDPANETPEENCPGGYPKVNGQCPVCIGGRNPDGTCVDDSGGASSGANSSAPASSPDSGSSGSAASTGGGDDDGGDDNGGGGGDDDGNGNNNGGGSASSSASVSGGSSGSNSSWTPHSGYGNWIPVSENSTCPNKYRDQSGQWWCAGGNSSALGDEPVEIEWTGDCNPTSKTYFSCITSQKLDGSGNASSIGWTPISGYGNWIPVTEDSNCPNKFKDASGNWWCAGGATGGGGGASGSAASGGASGSAQSAAGECDPTSRDYAQCVTSGKNSSRSSGSASSVSSGSASSSKSGAFSSLGEKGEFDGEASEKKMDELKEELDKKIADIKADIQGEFGGTISGSGGIQDFCENIRSAQVCFGLKKWEPYLDPISSAIFLVACVMAFSIVLRG